MAPIVINLGGKFGDIIQCLPAFKAIRDRTGVKPTVIVSKEFASVFEGVSYVTPDVTDAHWYNDVERIDAYIKERYGGAIWPQWWNAGNDELMKATAAHGGISLRVHGTNWSIDQSRYPGFMQSMWLRMGFTISEMSTLPLIFDRRSPVRENLLRGRVIGRHRKPVVLYNFNGQASPFAPVPEVMKMLEPFQSRIQFIDLAEVFADRIYDLIGLMDSSIGVITIDTASLHLVRASSAPYIAFTRDGWSGSVALGNVALNIKYSQAMERLNEVPPVLEKWIASKARRIVTCVGEPVVKTLKIQRTLALGDVLASTVVADRLAEQGYGISFCSSAAAHPILRRHGRIHSIHENTAGDINLDGAYETLPALERKQLTFAQIFTRVANTQLRERGLPTISDKNATPRINLSPDDVVGALNVMQGYPKPWITVCPRSASWANRTVPDRAWQLAAAQIKGTLFWLGMHQAPAGFVDLGCRHVDNLIRYIGSSDLLITVDSGPMHIAAALQIPIIAIEQASSPLNHLSDQNDFSVISAPLDCLNCQLNACPIDPMAPPCQKIDPLRIAMAANRRMKEIYSDSVSACVSIYRPEAAVLNRCLDALLPQVLEIVVCSDLAGKVPEGARQDPKIRYVRINQSDIGYGRKQNFAARHTVSPFLLFCNDDVFLDPGAVDRMASLLYAPDVGMVSNLLRYPEGTIYHAGKVRAPGARGWAHIDHGAKEPTFKVPTEIENACGACVLVKRSVFYSIPGFNELYYLYSEDDEFSLALRRTGHKIMFTPHSTGTHLNHHSTKLLGDMGKVLQDAARLFESRWGWYLDLNHNNSLGKFR